MYDMESEITMTMQQLHDLMEQAYADGRIDARQSLDFEFNLAYYKLSIDEIKNY